ncbi:16S rRNA (guanine1207-N2)-methyltransferase [Arcanobacterium pluranimalium]|uniref:class I SAM-dependent methyltransferase n=1 Tax=Arcanobacterium pluranimalium TaxID=108028 RepID=UPI00195B80E4|nr:methyltransferase [Arcanobacterium pluranimalium]MBM7824751.1 16S rRNA (guanine1207-N2)-methyltransferase [Arcanobacterium pluranimalium]
MNKIDELIVDNAREAGLSSADCIVVFDDPYGDLFATALGEIAQDRHRHVVVGSRTITQAKACAELADELLVRQRVHISGIDGSMRLDEFFAGLASVLRSSVGDGEGDSESNCEAEELGAGVSVLAMSHLPKALAELEYMATALALFGGRVQFVAGANTKHMSKSQNQVLEKVLGECRATLGVGKFRCLVSAAVGNRADTAYQVPSSVSDYGEIFGVGGAFGGPKIDFGGEFLASRAAEDMQRIVADPRRGFDTPPQIVDLGCGNASVSLQVLNQLPTALIYATDISADACASAQLTLHKQIESGNVQVTWDDAGSGIPSGWADFVLLNPPFHAGTRIDATMIQSLLDASWRVLRSGGDLYLVHNSYLRYRPEVEKRFDRVRELDRNAKFTVLQARK